MKTWIMAAFIIFALSLTGCGGSSNGSGNDTGTTGDTNDPADGRSLTDSIPEQDLTGDVLDDNSQVDQMGLDTIQPKDLIPDSQDPETTDPDIEDVGEDTEVNLDWSIKIEEPASDQTLSGRIKVKIVPVDADEVKPETVSLKVGDSGIYWDTKLPTEIILDTTTIPNGPVTLTASAKLLDHQVSDSVEIVLDNPTFSFKQVSADQILVANGDQISIYVSAGVPGLTVTGDFSALDSEYTQGMEEVYQIGGGKYMMTYTLSAANTIPDGTYNIPITVTDGSYTLNYQGMAISLQNMEEMPVRIDGGIYVPGQAPQPSSSWTQPITLVYGNDFIITGGSATLNVDFSGYTYVDEIIGIIVEAEGYTGFYQKPLENPSGEEEVLMLLRPYVEPEVPPTELNLRFAVVDKIGRISPYLAKSLQVQSVGSGDIQVSVSWDTPTDVDLHVIEPTGQEIYYGNDNSPSGGWLDLDSNAGCGIDGVNNENVFWPEGQAPIGTYVVRVDYWSDCSGYEANYTVTVHNCGSMDIYEGHFNANDADGGGAGSGVQITQFSNENCGRLLRGTIRYEDRYFDKFGFQARRWLPARYVTVELYRSSDNEHLATAWTDRSGHYDLTFDNKGTPGVYIKIVSRTNYDNGLRPITILNHPKFKQVYEVISNSIDETESEYPILNFDIPVEVGAGAFNILDMLADGSDLIRRMTGRNLGEISAYWSTGTDTTETLYCSEFFYGQGICSELGAMNIQGKDIDRDEYDDMIILKEFFKLVLDRVSNDSYPGGVHDGTRDDPRRAWTEGVSTFFASTVMGSQFFVNSMPFGVYQVQDLETMDTPFAYKTSNGNIYGQVSGYLVSSFLWDLVDDDSEAQDGVAGGANGVFDAIFNYLPAAAFEDRGVAGVDLVDFLDGWFCRGWDQKDAIESILVNERKFPYDFSGIEACPH